MKAATRRCGVVGGGWPLMGRGSALGNEGCDGIAHGPDLGADGRAWRVFTLRVETLQ